MPVITVLSWSKVVRGVAIPIAGEPKEAARTTGGNLAEFPHDRQEHERGLLFRPGRRLVCSREYRESLTDRPSAVKGSGIGQKGDMP